MGSILTLLIRNRRVGIYVLQGPPFKNYRQILFTNQCDLNHYFKLLTVFCYIFRSQIESFTAFCYHLDLGKPVKTAKNIICTNLKALITWNKLPVNFHLAICQYKHNETIRTNILVSSLCHCQSTLYKFCLITVCFAWIHINLFNHLAHPQVLNLNL